jgi:hypothetical protein
MAERAIIDDTPRKETKASGKKKDKRRKSTGKLIVSFKKKPGERKRGTIDQEEEVGELPPAGDVVKEEPEAEDSQLGEASSSQRKEHGDKKKSPAQKKKKSKKKKLDGKNQKVIDVQTYEVEDTNIVKVKKKKIYKKRKGSKVLVRMIKNHCNRAGDVVKTETVAVDKVPVDDNVDDGSSLIKEEDESMVVAEVEEADGADNVKGYDTLELEAKQPEQQAVADADDEEWEPENHQETQTKTTKKKTKKNETTSSSEKKKPHKQQASVGMSKLWNIPCCSFYAGP